MNYEKFVKMALKGRSVNQAAKDWGMQQTTLNRYVNGGRLPDFATAVKMAEEADMPLQEAMVILAREEISRKKRPVVAALAVAAVTMFLTGSPDPAQAAASHGKVDNNADYAMCLST